MNKNDILKILNEYKMDKNEFIIISGAALVLYGIKDKTSDIDITTTKNLYNKLLNNYNCIFEKHTDIKDINVYYIDNIINFSCNYYDKVEYTEYLGFKVQTVESILKLKKDLNREKDKNDIKLILEYLKK